MNKLSEIIRHSSFKLAVLLALLYLVLGFAFLHFDLADYGWIFFVLLPFSLGLVIGKMDALNSQE